MNRRGFLRSLGGLLAGSVLDPERLLWVPGRKMISIPESIVFHPNLSELDDYVKNHFSPALADLFFTQSPLFERLRPVFTYGSR